MLSNAFFITVGIVLGLLVLYVLGIIIMFILGKIHFKLHIKKHKKDRKLKNAICIECGQVIKESEDYDYSENRGQKMFIHTQCYKNLIHKDIKKKG